MNPITLPTSPETRAALEKTGWQVHSINAGYVVLMKGKSTVGLWADGNHTISATAPEWSEVAAILGIAPKGYHLIPESHYNLVLNDLAAVTRILDRIHDPRQYNPDLAGARNIARNCREVLDGTLFGPRLGPAYDQTTTVQADRRPGWPSSDPTPPHPAEDGGLSPSPLAAIDDDTAATMSAVLDREPGLHRVRLTAEPREEETP